MVKAEGRRFEVGDAVLVPWPGEPLKGEVIEVWGDPDDHVRVIVRFEDRDPMFFMMRSSVFLPAA